MEKHVQQNAGSKQKAKTGSAKKVKEDESFTDFLCPICLQILIEPVQMPCKHELCMDCFQKHVYGTSLTCPMCRFRISVWARKNTKANTLVHTERWNLIKKLFPERVKRRLDGLDDLDFDEYNAPVHVISSTGEVRKEYEEEVKKLQEESEKVMQANIEYIQKLQQQEHEEVLRQEELDRITAQELQQQEMSYLGVKLKSPSAHQEKLLALFKPKSPMKLRKRESGAYNSNLAKKKQFDLDSTKKTIKKYFRTTEISDSFYANLSHSDSKALEPPFVLHCTKNKAEEMADNKSKKKSEYNTEDKLIDSSVSNSKQPLNAISENSRIIKLKVEILNNEIDLVNKEKTEAKLKGRGLMDIAVNIEQ